MAIPYSRFYSEVQAIVDAINSDPNPEQRLSNLMRLTTDTRRLLLDARDEAAYETRTRYSGHDAAKLTGINNNHIDYWAHRHRAKHDLPRLRRMQRADLSHVMDLSGRQASPPDLPPSHPERQH